MHPKSSQTKEADTARRREVPTNTAAGSGAIESASDAPLPETALTFVRKPNPAVMATVTADRRPVSVATWYLIEDDGLLMLCMNADRARLKVIDTAYLDSIQQTLHFHRRAGPTTDRHVHSDSGPALRRYLKSVSSIALLGAPAPLAPASVGRGGPRLARRQGMSPRRV